jgi:hypothetical protein
MSGRFAAEVAGQRALYAAPERERRPAAASELLAQAETGSAALAALVAGWQSQRPSLAALAEAERAAAGVGRLLAELRQHAGGPADG